MSSTIIGIRPLQFVHVLDLNTNISRVESGPQTWVQKTSERLIGGPYPFVIVPPGHYCTIKNPCRNYTPGKPIQLAHGELAIRFCGEPFPLIPGERLVGAEDFAIKSSSYSGALSKVPVVHANQGLQLLARIDHKDEAGKERQAGEVWQVEGPITYRPTPHAEIQGFQEAEVIQTNESLRLRARQDLIDRHGNERVTGEEWLVSKEGAYLPGTFEEVLGKEQARTLTPNNGLYLAANVTLVDSLGKTRHAGDEWLVTGEDTEALVPQVGVEVLSKVKVTVLTKGEYCVVINPVDKDGKPQLGKKEVRIGVTKFFLHPGERLEQGIQKVYVLGDDEALVLSAIDQFVDTSIKEKPSRRAGERWMITGPTEYVPPVEVNILTKRKSIPLSKNEGVYVRDIQSGAVRAEMGPQSYMLTAYEELFKKQLSPLVEQMLIQGGGIGSADIRKVAYFEQSIDPAMIKGRDKTRIVTYRCPGNTACQVYNYKKKTARVIFGPDLVVLGPHENFNVLSVSAGKPKKPDALKSLCLMLGPDFISDIIEVETSDHARLQIKLAFNNYFDVDKNDAKAAAKIFAVPDFIGFAARQIGGKIRASVAHCSFDTFHRNSTRVIQHAVFGLDENQQTKKQLTFEANNLVVTSVDVQSIEPVDLKMRESLMKSVQMAIEIATSSVEAAASHEARRIEQAAKGKLERQKLQNEKEAEEARIGLHELHAMTAAVESTGQAVAEAQARAESMIIECRSHIECAKLKASAEEIEHAAELETQTKARNGELIYQRAKYKAEVYKLQKLTEIEVNKFQSMVGVLGIDTISAIARAGPETKVKLLSSLGIESTLITDGNSPVNLFNTAKGMIAQ